MIEYILATLFICANAQYAPQWGSISCDTSLTDWFPPGSEYTGYNRYYTLTTAYPTLVRRNVKISTCTEDSPVTISANFQGSASLRRTSNPTSTITTNDDANCEEGEIGITYTWTDLPEDDFEIGINNGDSSGGKYKLSVECIEPSTPTPDQLKDTNVTQTFEYRNDFIRQGSKKISCGVNALDTIQSGDDTDWYEFTITQYAQEIWFTTCIPENAQDGTSNGFPVPPTRVSNHRLRYRYWSFDDRNPDGWLVQSSNTGSTCTNLQIGDAYAFSSSSNIKKLSPGTNYIGVERTGQTDTDVNYALSMMCWNNDAVANAIAGTDYVTATYNPTMSPVTSSPTVASPTANNPQTSTPTTYPTVTFDGIWDRVKKTMNMGQISCGIHQHNMLAKKHSDYYIFQVLSGGSGGDTLVYFDTCMNDLTRFHNRLTLYEYNGGDDFSSVYNVSSTTKYCNTMSLDLSPNIYYIEISGESKLEDWGEYVLRMGCGYMESDTVTAVSVTDAPTPSPTGVADIPAKDGRVVGDIMCGVTVEGTTSSQRGDFHKFTVIAGGIDWVKFDTCESTSFNNYLFIYDYWNQTAHEQWNYNSHNSIGFHYEDDTTCNEMTMNDLVPGVYYVNIDGYNYYFDHGEYTITMSCSDNSAIKSTSNFTEYSAGLPWWAILLIVLAILICCGGIIFIVCYMKRKGDGGSNSGGGQTEMGTKDAGE
eukprot:70871_1